MSLRSKLLVGALFVGLFAWSGPSAFAQAKPGVVTIGYLALVNAQLVSKQMGWHEQEMGLKIKWVKFDSGRDVNTAIASGSIDFGGVGNPPATVGVSRGLPYEGIFVLNVLGAVESLVVRKDRGINKIEDLAGKTVAVPFGSTTHYSLVAALRLAKVDPMTVKIIDMSPSDMVAAWLRGDIDAGYTWEPNLHKMVLAGGKILLTSEEMHRKGFTTGDVAVVHKSFAEEYPNLVAKFVKTEARAVDFWLKNFEESVKLVAREFSIKEEDARRMMQGTVVVPGREQLSETYLGTAAKKGRFVGLLRATADFLYAQKILKAPVETAVLEKFINPSYLEKALK